MSKISNRPPAFVIKSGLNSSNKRKISNLVINSIDTLEDHSFEAKIKDKTQTKAHISTDKHRLNVSLPLIFENSTNYKEYLESLVTDVSLLKQLTKFIVPTMQQHYLVNSSDPFLDKNVSIIARARHYVDFRGFYLAKHNDSLDTFVAYLCPLETNATTTSLFVSNPNAGNFRSTHEISKLNFIYNSQFAPNRKIATVSDGDPGIVAEYTNSDLRIYSHSRINLKQDEAIVLPNIDFKGFQRKAQDTSYLKQISQEVGHGVYPPIQELLRPILLIDYCLTSDRLENGKIYPGKDSNALIGSLCTLADLNQFI